jgi:hypothetical protein
MKIEYDFIFIFERLDRMHEIKNIFFSFLTKPNILIPDLYLYNIKIQTDIDQNIVKNLQKIIDFFEIIFEYFFGLSLKRSI